MFNDRGSQSVPSTVPLTRRNIRLLQAPHRVDSDCDPNAAGATVDVVQGGYVRRGVMNVTEAGRTHGVTFNIGFDNSTAYAKWQSKKLSGLEGLPVFKPTAPAGSSTVNALLDELYRVYTSPDSLSNDFAVFPIALSRTEVNGTNYFEMLNVAASESLTQPGSVKRVIDGTVTDVNVPQAYAVSPFLRVWRVLELIFADLGVEMLSNPFKTPELSRLTVLNNAADACCRGEIKYIDIMPDCTVQEFLNALWVRFGLVYHIDDTAGTVRLALLKDIISAPAKCCIDAHVCSYGKLSFKTKQYVKLSAKTSLEGAAVSSDRFEDFSKGLDIDSVKLGADVANWLNVGSPDYPEWSGESFFDPWRDWNFDDDFPGLEHPEPASMSAPRRSRLAYTEADGTFLAREYVTGKWFQLDATHGRTRATSSGFFNWDPQPDGVEALELSSEDECVPVERVNTVGLGVGNDFDGFCPSYLVGSRHYHSYVRGNDDDKTDDKTPLAFMLAYPIGGKTVGRLSPEGENGLPVTLDDGSTPTVSLFFQFSDGLFAKFWKEYDEILRHGNRSVEVDARINKIDLLSLNPLEVLQYGGTRCLLDTASYSLPSGRDVSTTLNLRTVQTVGEYDIKVEQNIPNFAAAARHLEWRLLGENFDENLDNTEAKQAAADAFTAATGYQPRQEADRLWFVGALSAEFSGIERNVVTWENDPELDAPIDINQKLTRNYLAIIRYDIYEMSETPTLKFSPEPIGTAIAEVEYTVVIAPGWVAD